MFSRRRSLYRSQQGRMHSTDLLHRCITPQLSLLLFRFVAFHYDMTKWNLLGRSFSLKGLVQSSKKSQRKRKSLQRYRAKCIKRQLYGKYYKMFASKNDRSKWPARREFDERQAHGQAGHCPLTGCYFEPCSVLNGFNFYFWWCDSDNREQYWNYEYMKTI